MSFIIIPDTIKKSKEISSTSKLIYGDILSLSAKHGYCYANNEYFAKIYDISTRAVSKIIGQLLEFNIIEIRNSTCEFSKAREIVPMIFADTEQKFEEVGTKVPRTKVLEYRNKSSEHIEQKFEEVGTKVQNDRNKSSNIIDNRINNIIDNRINNIIDNRINNENISDFSFSENSQDLTSLNYKKELKKVNRANFVNDKKKKSTEKTPQIYPANFTPAIIRAVENFIEYRKEIKKPFKSEKSQQTKINQWSDQIEAYGEAIVLDSIETAIGNGWQGTFIDMKKVELQKQSNNFNNQFKTKRDANFAHYFSQLRDVDYGFND